MNGIEECCYEKWYVIMLLLPILGVILYCGDSVIYRVQVKMAIKEMRENCMEQIMTAIKGLQENFDDEEHIRAFSAILEQMEEHN